MVIIIIIITLQNRPTNRTYITYTTKAELKSPIIMSNPEKSLPPGFRFHPTDEELIVHYLNNRTNSFPCPVPIIVEVDIYKFSPWELPGHYPSPLSENSTVFGDREWYFFTPRGRKYPNGTRPNRAAGTGYWKATGTDRPVVSSGGGSKIGVKKSLVFYRGRSPKGCKTNWFMHEYRLSGSLNTRNTPATVVPKPIRNSSDDSMRLDDWVLCRIYQKNSKLRSLETEVNKEEEANAGDENSYFPANFSKQSHGSMDYNIVPCRLPKVLSLTDIFRDTNSDLSRHLQGSTSPENSNCIIGTAGTASLPPQKNPSSTLETHERLLAEEDGRRHLETIVHRQLPDDDQVMLGQNLLWNSNPV